MTAILGRGAASGGILGAATIRGEGPTPASQPPVIPPPDPILWLTTDSPITGTGSEVDTWATQSTSGLSILEAGTGKPFVSGNRVDMDNATTQQNYFVGPTTATFQAMTETGVFSFAWRGVIAAYDAPQFTIDMSILHTRGASGRGVNAIISASGSTLSFVTWNGAGAITHRCDYGSFDTDYTIGDPYDVVVQADGTSMRMYLDGVEVGTTGTVSTDPGVHATTPHFGRLTNAGLYHIGSVEGIFYDDTDTYSIADLRSYVTNP